jgi:hypothetical protein
VQSGSVFPCSVFAHELEAITQFKVLGWTEWKLNSGIDQEIRRRVEWRLCFGDNERTSHCGVPPEDVELACETRLRAISG